MCVFNHCINTIQVDYVCVCVCVCSIIVSVNDSVDHVYRTMLFTGVVVVK